MINLEVKLSDNLVLKNPVMTASGTFGYGPEYADFIDLSRLGGILVKGTTLNPRQGNPYPRMAETPSGMLNAVGLQNPGVDAFIKDIYPRIKDLDTAIIVNVSGACPEDYAEVCRRLQPLYRIAAVEVNISCPNVKQGGMAFGTTCAGAETITRAVRDAYNGTVIVKLSPNVTDVTEIAKAAEGAGADALSLTNTFLGMAVDVDRMKPVLSTVTGGLSGPCIRPIAVRMVWQVCKAVKVPVIGLGGIMCGRDALEFMMAGARAVQVGTANFIDPSVTVKIIDEITDFCERHGVKDINEIVGII
ncbi:MAG: dihydroorotate dehydrogenase [Muribaculaceae bacterium]|nr:dihydroorotate dehydrogenase [Muribaculaceae bacterium]